MDLPKMLEGALHGRIKPMITHCTLLHLRALPSSIANPILRLTREKCELRRCGHHELADPLSTMDCLLDCVDPKNQDRPEGTAGTNKHRYVVATQDGAVRGRLREIPGTPLLYVKRSVLVMEPMAQRSVEVQEREERGKFRVGLKPKRGVKRKRDEDVDDGGGSAEEGKGDAVDEQEVTKKKKRKGPKGPNPLSVLKPKKRPVVQTGLSEKSSSRKGEAQANEGGLLAQAEDQPKKKRKRKHRSGKTSGVEAGSGGISVLA